MQTLQIALSGICVERQKNNNRKVGGKMEGITIMILSIAMIPIILAIVGMVLIIRGIIRWRKHKKKGEGIIMIVFGFLLASMMLCI